MNESFESVNLEDYTLDISECLQEYVIVEEKQKTNCTVLKGYIRDSQQLVRIYRWSYDFRDKMIKYRFVNLMKAFDQGIILADNIFLCGA